MIDVSEIRKFYDEKYSAMLENTFPCDIVRFESWLDGVLPMVGRQSRVLDVGCGVGFVCSYLEGKGYEAQGCDISVKALQLAKASFPKNSFNLMEEPEKLPYDSDYFQLVTCFGVLEHSLTPDQLVQEISRVLRKGGYGVFVVANSWSPYFWRGGTNQVIEIPRSCGYWHKLFTSSRLVVEKVKRDPGPAWHRNFSLGKKIKWVLHKSMNFLPLKLTYQFVFIVRK